MAQHDHCHVASSQKALMLEMKSLQEEPVEGFKITLVDEADMYNWEVAIFGPPNTHYEGGYFKVRILHQRGTLSLSNEQVIKTFTYSTYKTLRVGIVKIIQLYR